MNTYLNFTYSEFINDIIQKGFSHYNVIISNDNVGTKVFKHKVCLEIYDYYINNHVEFNDVFIENYYELLKYFEDIEEYCKCSNLYQLYKSYINELD